MLATRSNHPRAEFLTFAGEVAPNDFARACGDGAGKKRGGRLSMRHVALGVCVALLLAAWPVSSYSQAELTTVAVGTNPVPVVLNPVTNRIYVASFQDNTVKVIDGATAAAIATVTVTSPGALAVNTTTNMIYVADTNANTVTVIDGATNTAGTPITVGTTPIAVAVNPVTNMIYVGNQASNNVSVIDGSTNTVIVTVATGLNPQVIGVNPVTNLIYVVNNESSNVSVINGAGTPQGVIATVNAGSNPLSIGVNTTTNLIYVANSSSNTVTVINGAVNTTASNVTVATGSQPRVLTVNPVTNKIYAANHNANTVTVIDGSLNTTASNKTITVGTAPVSIAVNPTTNQIYVANHTSGAGGGTLSVINGSLNTTASVVTVPFAVGAFPTSLAVNPVTNQVYAADQSSNDLSVFDGATNLTNTVDTGTSSQVNGASIAANPATNKIYVPNSFSNTVTVYNANNNETTTISAQIGTIPNNAAVNVVTNKIYVTNLADSTVSVIDGSTDMVSDVVAVGTSSQVNRTSIAVNPVTNKIYVPNSFSNTVTVIDGVDDSTTTITAGIGTIPNAVAINPVTNRIYVTNLADATVSVIDGNSDTVVAVVTVGSSSQVNGSSIAVNPATNKIYVPNSFSNTVTVINGATNATTTISAMIGTDPNNVAINPVTNKIYVTNLADATVSVIDGSTDTVNAVVTVGSSSQTNRTSIAVNPVTNKIYVPNSFTNTVTVIDGATNKTRTVTPGMISNAVAVNLATNNIYVTNLADSTVTAISEEQVQPIPLITTIAPFSGNVVRTSTPTFTFTATNDFPIPINPIGGLRNTATPAFVNASAISLGFGLVTNVYYQVDTWEGPWVKATPTGGNFTGTSTVLRQGTHVVYAFATDGEESHSTGLTQQLVGQITAEVFTVILPGTFTDLNANNNPAAVGQAVTFTAAVDSKSGGGFTGTVQFFDGATLLGSGTLVSGMATFTTSALTLGSHSITAVYSGDGNFSGSTSQVLTEVIAASNPVPVATSLSPTFATAGDATFTLTVNGSGFVSGSVVNWNGVALATTFVSATQLTAVVPASDVANAGTAQVTVFSPALGGGTSGALTFTINNPVPLLEFISPNRGVGGGSAFTLTVHGGNFVSGSVVKWNGVALTTTFVSSSQLTAAVPSSDLANSGTAAVSVFNPLPGGGNSVTTATFTITVPVPVLTAIAPSSAAAGSPAFTMTLTGTSFISTSVARWNGADLATTFESPTQLTALVPAADVLTVGTASVTVFNPVGVAQVVKSKVHPHSVGPSGQTSNALTFTINAGNPVPVLNSMSPTSAVGGSASFTLTVNGSNFVSGSTVTWNGVARATTFVSSTQLTAAIPSSDLLSSGSATVGVSSPVPGGGNSVTTLTFTITVPVPVLTTIAPSSAAAGSPSFTMTLTGNTFISTSVARWNGADLPTTFVSATQLTAQVPAADVLTVGTASVAVFNPAGVAQVVKAKVHPEGGGPSGVLSNALTFTITAANPTPVLGSVSPTSETAGGAAFTLTVTGTGFVSGATVQWNGMTLVTTFVSATQLTAVVPANDLATAGTASVTVFNPTPGGGVSNAVTETISAATTTTTVTVSPTPPVAGQPITFTVTIAPPPTGSSLGTVSIFDGTTLLGTANVNSSGVAMFTTSALTAGSHSITAVFSGNASSAMSTSAVIPLTVNAAASFGVTAPQTPFILMQGGSVSIPITVPPVGGAFNSAVTMSATGLPPGATASFAPPVVTPGSAGATTVLTIQLAPLRAGVPARPRAPRGPFPAAPVTLALVALGFVLTYRRPRALRLAFAAVAFAGAVILFAGCNGGFSGGQRTTPGNYTITVTGTSGTQHVSTTVTLAVQ